MHWELNFRRFSHSNLESENPRKNGETIGYDKKLKERENLFDDNIRKYIQLSYNQLFTDAEFRKYILQQIIRGNLSGNLT